MVVKTCECDTCVHQSVCSLRENYKESVNKLFDAYVDANAQFITVAIKCNEYSIGRSDVRTPAL